MAVRIRLKRIGRRNRPCYRIAAIDSRKPRGGREIEIIGTYDPLAPKEEDQIKVVKERAEYWLKVGAKPSFTVLSFFQRADVTLPPRTRRKRRRKKTREEA